ncbi:hypothetical protein CYMTET_22596 [Cymbomonas tetramitiformis]|uniref:Uncharacterized protein n=1 Tax=Cymbomonas tetramitiformis TaxID=36881 RepID=A0AAE0G047_9CHLO|nr:hypothetical protein CYMTET_22596 [Cymbomonas tetramitiformis]
MGEERFDVADKLVQTALAISTMEPDVRAELRAVATDISRHKGGTDARKMPNCGARPATFLARLSGRSGADSQGPSSLGVANAPHRVHVARPRPQPRYVPPPSSKDAMHGPTGRQARLAPQPSFKEVAMPTSDVRDGVELKAGEERGAVATQSDHVVACETIRAACLQNPQNTALWNRFACITMRDPSLTRHSKFLAKVVSASARSRKSARWVGMPLDLAGCLVLSAQRCPGFCL